MVFMAHKAKSFLPPILSYIYLKANLHVCYSFSYSGKLSLGPRNDRRKSRQSYEKLSLKDQRSENQKKGLNSHSLSAKSMPSLNRKNRAETRQSSFKKPSSQKKLIQANVNEKTKSLPNVSEAAAAHNEGSAASSIDIDSKLKSTSLEKETEQHENTKVCLLFKYLSL